MSKTVDERVVSMRFDNQQFERGVRQTSDSLQKFKEKFNFKQQETEFDRLQGLVNTFSLTHMASELSSLGDRFGLFGTIAGRALENITDKAMSTVHNLINQLGIGFGGIKDGFAEYELQINSVQTMLANMSRESESTADTMMTSASRISSSLQEMATQVVRGDWGNGQDRIEALGQYYKQIQDAVNDAWAVGGKVPEGWEKGLETITGEIVVAAEDAGEAIEGIGDATMTAEERNKKNLEKIEHNLGILNEYADKTVYTFSDMTNAIGQFMTAGVDLDTSTEAIQGLSNIAAAFGVDNNRLKNTFYQLSQAINSGKVQLMDWRSVINANMSGPLFRDEIINTAKEMGALIDTTNMSEKEFQSLKDAAHDAGKSVADLSEVQQDFNGSLRSGWFTADILTAAISKFTSSGLAEYFEETTGVAKDYGEELINAYLDAEDATESQNALNKAIEEFSKSGEKGSKEVQNYIERLKNVTDAATKVKSATQLIQVIREGIGTGWADTFKIVIGDFYEAQDLFTGISNKVNGFINDVANARNKILQEWKEKGGRSTLIETLGKIFDFTDADSIIYNLIKPIKDALLEVFNLEGFNSDNLVNATNKFKAIVENVAKFIKDHYEEIKGIVKLVAVYFRLKFNIFMTKIKLILFLLKLFSPVLKVIFEIVGKVAGALGNLLNQSSGISGIISGMTDAFNGLGNSLSGISSIKLPDLSGFTDKLGLGSINLSGLGSVGDTISQFVGGIAGAGQNADAAEATIDETQKLLDETQNVVQQASDIDTEKIDESTDKIVKSSQKQRKAADTISDSIKFVKSKLKFTKTGDKDSDSVAGSMSKAVKAMADTISRNSKIDPADIQKGSSKLRKLKDAIEDVSYETQKVGQSIANFFYIDTEAIKKTLNLPEKGGFWVILGRIKDWFAANYDNILSLIKTILAYKAVNSLVAAIGGLAKISESIAYAAGAMGRMFDSIGHAVKSAAKSLKMKAIGEMFRDLAIGVGILVGAVAGLSALNPERLWPAVGALATIVAIFLAMSYAASKISAIDTPKIAAIALFMVTFGISIAILTAALKSLAKLDADQIKQGLSGVVIAIVGVIAAAKILEMGPDKTLNKVAGTLLALSVSILLLGAAVKSFAKMSGETFVSGIIRVALSLVVFTKAVKGIQSSAKENTKSAGTLIALSVSLLLLGSAIKKFSKMDPEQFYRGLVRIALGLIVLVGAISLLNKGANTTVFNKGQKAFNPIMKTLLGMSAAMLVLSLVIKMISSIPIEKALPAVGMLGAIMLEFAYLSNTMIKSAKYMNSGKGVAKVLLGFAFSLLIISLIVKIIGSTPIGQAIQGVVLISGLMWELVGAYSVIATVGDIAKKSMGPMIIVAITMAILGVVVNILSKTNTAQAFAAVGELGILLGSLAAVMFSIAETTKITKKGDLVAGATLFFFLAIIGAALGHAIAEFSNEIQNPVASIALAGAVAILIGAMAGVLIAIAGATKIGINEAEIKDVGALLAALTIVTAALAGIIGRFSNITKAKTVIPLATAVSELLLAMIPVFAAIASISKASILISPGEILKIGIVFDILASLFTFSLAGVLAAIGAIPWGPAIDNGLEILKNIGTKLGEAIAGFIEAISLGMLKAAQNIAKGLEAVFGQITSLVDSLHSKVDDNSVEMIKSVIKLIAVMTTADFLDALTSWFTASIPGHKKSNIADRIKDLGVGIAGLQESMNGVDYYKLKELSGVFDSVANVLVAISSLVLSNTYSDLITFFTGGGNQKNAMSKLTDGLSGFIQNGFIPAIRMLIEEIPDYKTETATKKVQMLGTFAEALRPLQDIMPKTTSLVSIIVGQADNNWGKLGESLGDFIKHMTAAVMIITADVAVDADGNQVKAPNDAKFDKAKTRIETISQFTNSFKEFDTIRGNTPSLKGFIFGEKLDWGDFGRSLSAFVIAMNNAVNTLTGDINDENWQNESWPGDTKFDQAAKRFAAIGTFTSDFKKYYEIMPQPVEISNMFGNFKFGTTWDQFGGDLENFVTSLVNIVKLLATNEDMEESKGFLINLAVERMNKLGQLADPLAKFHELIIPAVGLINQIHQNLTGEGEWAKFGNDLKQFISSMMTVCQLIGDDENWTNVDDIDTLLENVEERSKSLGKLGEALTKFTAFINTIAFQEGKGSIIRVLNTDGSEFTQYVSAIEQTVKDIPILAQSLVDMAKSIELNKTFIDNLGDENSGTISRIYKLKEMAEPIAGFVEAFVNLDKSDSQTAGENLKEVLNAFSEISDDTGKTGLGKFAEGLDEFVNELVIVGQNLVLNEGSVTKSINILKDISEIKFGESFTDLDVFANGAAYLAAALRRIGESLNDENVKKALEEGGFSKLNMFIESMKSVLAEGVPTFESTGTDLAKALINGFMNGKNGENGFSIKSQFTEILLDICQRVTKDWEPVYTGMFKDLGRHMVEGFAEGMRNSEAMARVVNSAKAMANAAKETTEKQLDEHSPSRVMRKVGRFVPLGFAQGIGDRSATMAVKKSAESMANAIVDTTKRALEIHSPSQVMKTLGEYTIQGFIDGIQNGIPKVQRIAKMISESISKIPATMNGEEFAKTTLGSVSKIAVAGISNAMSEASNGTMSFDDATKVATDSVFKFAAALYAETDASTSAQEELNNLENERQELLKKQEENNKKLDEATARRDKAIADEVEYRKTHINDELDKISDETLRTTIRDKLNRYQDITEALRDTNIVDFDKKKLENEQKEIDAFLDSLLESIDDTKNTGEKSLRDMVKEIVTNVKEGHATIGDILNDNEENIKSIGETGKEIGDEIIDKNEEIAKKNQEIVNEILQQWVEFRNKIRDNVKSFLSIFSGESIKIDLFSETESSEDKYLEDRKSKLEEITEAEKELKEAEEELIKAQRELAEAQQRSDNVEGRSLIALNDIEEATNRVTEAEQKRAEAQEALANTQKTLTDYDEENSAEGIGKKMLETMGKNIDAYHTFDQNLKALAQMGLDPEYLAELRKNGMSSAEQVAKLFAAASSETMGVEFRDKFNEYIRQQRDIQSETYKQSLEDKIDRAKEWTKNLATLRKAGLDEGLIKEIIDNGPDNSELMDILLHDIESGNTTEIEKWNELYTNLDSTSNAIADAVTTMLTEEAKYAESIVDAILRANSGNMIIDFFGKGDILNKVLSSDEAMRQLYVNTANEEYNRLLEIGYKGEGKDSIMVKAYTKALEAVNLAANEINHNTNGAYALQYGLIEMIPEVKKAGETVGQAYGEGIETGTKKSLGIKSPSRVFMEIGKFVDLGFAKGVKDNTPKVASALSALGDFDPDPKLLDFEIQNGSLLNFGTTQDIARGISPNATSSVERLMRDFLANQNSTPSNTDNSTTTNNFNITSNNPKEVAYEVDKILQQKIIQRRSSWG